MTDICMRGAHVTGVYRLDSKGNPTGENLVKDQGWPITCQCGRCTVNQQSKQDAIDAGLIPGEMTCTSGVPYVENGLLQYVNDPCPTCGATDTICEHTRIGQVIPAAEVAARPKCDVCGKPLVYPDKPRHTWCEGKQVQTFGTCTRCNAPLKVEGTTHCRDCQGLRKDEQPLPACDICQLPLVSAKAVQTGRHASCEARTRRLYPGKPDEEPDEPLHARRDPCADCGLTKACTCF